MRSNPFQFMKIILPKRILRIKIYKKHISFLSNWYTIKNKLLHAIAIFSMKKFHHRSNEIQEKRKTKSNKTELKRSANNPWNSYRITICATDRQSLEDASRSSFHQRWRRSSTCQAAHGALALKLTFADTGEPLCRETNKSDERCESTIRLTFPLWTRTKTGGRKMSCTPAGSRVELIRFRLAGISRNYWEKRWFVSYYL